MVWVGKIETPVNLVVEKEMEKIPKFKSLKMATSSAGKSGVFMRDKSCICKECQPGNVLCCTDEKNVVPTSDLILERVIKIDQLERTEE